MNMENRKYRLVKSSEKSLDGTALFQLVAKMSFGTVAKGDRGGYVEKLDNLDDVGDAWVSGNARVSGDAWVSGDARVSGNAQVFGDVWVCGDARVYGGARVCGGAWVFGDARVSGDALVFEDARVDNGKIE